MTPHGNREGGIGAIIKVECCVVCAKKSRGGGTLYKFGKSMGAKSSQEMVLPKQAFAVIPISDILDRVSCKLSIC